MIKNLLGKQYVSNTFWMFLDKILKIISALFAGSLVIRHLGAETFGSFAFVQSYIAIFSSVASLGTDEVLIKDIVENKIEKSIVMSTIFLLRIFGITASFLAIFFSSQLIQSTQVEINLLIIMYFSLILIPFNIIELYLRTNFLSLEILKTSIVITIVTIILKLYGVWNNSNVYYFSVLIVVESILTVLLLYILKLKHKIVIWNTRGVNWNYVKTSLKYSLPLMLSGLMVSVYMKIDNLMIKSLLGPREVGIYSGAVRISEFWYFIPIVIVSSYFPVIIKERQIDEKKYYKKMRNLYRLMIYISILYCVFILIFSKNITNILYGEDYLDSFRVMNVHVWSGLFATMGIVTSKMLVINGKQVNGLINCFLGVLANIIFNVIFIKEFGYIGAAYATIIAQIISGFIAPCFFTYDKQYPKLVFNSLISKWEK